MDTPSELAGARAARACVRAPLRVCCLDLSAPETATLCAASAQPVGGFRWGNRIPYRLEKLH